MLAISPTIAVGAFALLLASYDRLRTRDLSINPIAKAGPSDDTNTVEVADADLPSDGQHTPA